MAPQKNYLLTSQASQEVIFRGCHRTPVLYVCIVIMKEYDKIDNCLYFRIINSYINFLYYQKRFDVQISAFLFNCRRNVKADFDKRLFISHNDTASIRCGEHAKLANRHISCGSTRPFAHGKMRLYPWGVCVLCVTSIPTVKLPMENYYGYIIIIIITSNNQ